MLLPSFLPMVASPPCLLCCLFLSFVSFEWLAHDKKRGDRPSFHQWPFYPLLRWEYTSIECPMLVNFAYLLLGELSPIFPVAV